MFFLWIIVRFKVKALNNFLLSGYCSNQRFCRATSANSSDSSVYFRELCVERYVDDSICII